MISSWMIAFCLVLSSTSSWKWTLLERIPSSREDFCEVHSSAEILFKPAKTPSRTTAFAKAGCEATKRFTTSYTSRLASRACDSTPMCVRMDPTCTLPTHQRRVHPDVWESLTAEPHSSRGLG